MTMHFEPQDLHHLHAAKGWLGLGEWRAANDEIWQITPRLRNHPAVLLVRCDILARTECWNSLLLTASKLAEVLPDNVSGWVDRSYALAQMGRAREAFDLLRAAVVSFPNDSCITYNLACCSAQLGRLQEARHWLARTSMLRDVKTLKQEALADPDLEALWPEIARIPTTPQPALTTFTTQSPVRFDFFN